MVCCAVQYCLPVLVVTLAYIRLVHHIIILNPLSGSNPNSKRKGSNCQYKVEIKIVASSILFVNKKEKGGEIGTKKKFFRRIILCSTKKGF